MLSFPQRCLVAGRAFWFYLGKLLWPANLCFVYPRWNPDSSSVWQWVYPIAAAGIVLGLWFARGRIGRGPATAVLFYLGALFPLLGFLNAYGMRYSFVWDHWVYLPGLGIIALVGALITWTSKSLRSPAMAYGFAVIVLPMLAFLTWRQAGTFINMETLWRVTIARNPHSYLAYDSLGIISLQKGELDEALILFRKAVEIQLNPETCNNLGLALLRKGNVDEALIFFRKAVELQSNSATCNSLGLALIRKGNVDEAINYFRKAVEHDPNNADAQDSLGLALLQKGRLDEAMVHLQKAVAVRPNDAKAQNNLGSALLLKGQWTEAAAHLRKALELQPDFAEACGNLGFLSLHEGQTRAAVAYFQRTLALQPDNADACKYLAWILATSPDASVRNGVQAVELAQQADRLSGGNNPAILATLAAAEAEVGHFPDALATAQKALPLANAQTNTAVVNALRNQIGFYKKDLPFRDNSLTNIQAVTQ